MSDDEKTMRIYGLEDIERIATMQETVPWPADDALTSIEAGYRRGYLHGWQEAVDALYSWMAAEHATLDQACAAADRHRQRLLGWMSDARAHAHGEPLFAATCKRDFFYEHDGDWPPTWRGRVTFDDSDTDDGKGEDGDM